ncbi:MAG: hypothetical protein HC779_00265 [Phyllobacteriaceae bacterium]|nr:hypothetical protein [Phyllobacteriaceae bacterium]
MEPVKIGAAFGPDSVGELFGEDFAATLTEAEKGVVATSFDSWLAGFILINYVAFNPIKEEMDQILSPMAQ